MADVIDLANDHAEHMLQLALNRATPARTVRASAQFCEDCGDAIPLLRQQTIDGCETCVSCQGIREQRR